MPLRCARKARSDGTKYVFCTGSKYKRLIPSYLKKKKTSKKSVKRKTKTKKASPAKAASPRRSSRTRKAPSRLGF